MKLIENKQPEQKYDPSKIYTYKEFPDKIGGRRDNCGNTTFKSFVKDFIFLRECNQCGLKKKTTLIGCDLRISMIDTSAYFSTTVPPLWKVYFLSHSPQLQVIWVPLKPGISSLS